MINILKKLFSKNKTRGFEMVVRAKIEILKHTRWRYVKPQRGTDGSCGYDFTLPRDVYIKPNEVIKVKSGYKVYMKKDEVLKLYPRSSTSTKLRVTLANDVAIIDSDFYNNPDNEGEITLALLNEGDKPIRLKCGERVAQGVFLKYLVVDNDKPKDKHRVGGFGSTNKK